MYRILQYIFLFLSIVFFILSLFHEIFYGPDSSENTGGDKVVFVLDVSQSMNVSDVDSGTRLDTAKNYIYDILKSYEGYQFALNIFAGESQRILPFTHDIALIATFTQGLDSNNITQQGTQIDEALEDALTNFSDDEVGGNIIILTDGSDDKISVSRNVIQQIQEKKLQVSIIGVGTKGGGPVPSGDFFEPYKIYNGKRVISVLNSDTLSELAQALGGIYYENTSGIQFLTQEASQNRENHNFFFKLSAICWGIFLLCLLLELYMLRPKIGNKK